MKWYVVISLCFCAANFVTSLAIVGLSTYHLYDEERFVPVKQCQDWYEMVIGLIPFAIFVMVVSLFSLWGVIQKNRKWTASVIALNAACIGGSILFVIFFSQLADATPIGEEELEKNTKEAISKLLEQSDDVQKWIPQWLDRVQKDSPACCGIETYKDWEEFWPLTPSLIPRSCCLNPSDDTAVCPKDLARIPYPGTPAKFIKVEHGCVDEINEQIKRHILETYKFVWILTAFVIVGEIAYSLLYFFRYYCPGEMSSGNNIQKINIKSGGDMGDYDDSCDGLTKITVTQVGSSVEALPGEIRIDPDTGNPVVSFNIVSYDNNVSRSQSGSSSITSAVLPSIPTAKTKPLPDLNTYRVNSQNRIDSSSDFNSKNTTASPGFQYNGQTSTISDPVSSNNKPQRRAVFLVQDSPDYIGSTMDEITSGLGSSTSFDDFGDLPSQETGRDRNKSDKEKAAGVTRNKKRFNT